jgi:hypothetical protein
MQGNSVNCRLAVFGNELVDVPPILLAQAIKAAPWHLLASVRYRRSKASRRAVSSSIGAAVTSDTMSLANIASSRLIGALAGSIVHYAFSSIAISRSMTFASHSTARGDLFRFA